MGKATGGLVQQGFGKSFIVKPLLIRVLVT